MKVTYSHHGILNIQCKIQFTENKYLETLESRHYSIRFMRHKIINLIVY